MAAPMKVSHVGKQPTSLNGELGSVSQISMATQISPESRKNVTQLQNPRDLIRDVGTFEDRRANQESN